ncbi:MAG TPA: hypothetical protein PLM53_08935 [Spirochaetota bacterium]|nr:hypothetical protein [Spirochaetota bacterium]HPL16441.1 hypothetical protein [Spirochaetota bacterium]HQF08552.1 hypothetical protein [Spirochaetota bacterium]HQH97211.1 hypothetical protein [Spirochaetota bacterium]HQJ70518.1 hypothetical protein [Spirochaetota bacterium]
MRRFPVIIALLALGTPVFGSEGAETAPRVVITAEYRQDTLDYDDVEKRFFRETARLTFGGSSASFTHVNVGMTRENRFTWHIRLRGLSPYCEAIIGNYFANFGAGLLVGRKTALSPDLFKRTLTVSLGNPFTPCSSGNPYFSFQGIAAGLRYSSEGVSLSLDGYYSFRNRFARTDRRFPGYTGSTFNSILMRTKKDYRYSEPVEIHDCGYSLILRIAGHLTMQSYFIYSSIKRSGNHNLVFNYDTRPAPGGEKNFYGYGFYFQYRDDYILIFVDFCFPGRVISRGDGRTRTVRGFGIMYGLAFRARTCSLSFTGKQTDTDYYSPYSSGKSTPGTACMTSFSVRPFSKFTLGASFFTEKNRMPSGNEQYLRFTRREQVFFGYGAHLKGSCSVRAALVEWDTKEKKERHLRISSSSKIYIMKSILFTFGGAVQRKIPGRYSGYLSVGTRFTLFNAVTFTLRYSRFCIASGTPLYAAADRQAGSINRSMAVKSSSNILTGGLVARFEGCRLSLEYLHQFTRRRTIRNSIEAAATCLF